MRSRFRMAALAVPSHLEISRVAATRCAERDIAIIYTRRFTLLNALRVPMCIGVTLITVSTRALSKVYNFTVL